MKIAYTVEDVKSQVRQWKKEGLTVGLVPTMGYLHEGHESLIKRAVAENDRVVVSVFLNPTQFAPNEDLASYPRDFEADTKLCEGAGAALVFHPEPSEMYAEDACTFVDMTAVTKELCGKSRPIHFRGVCTVVNKLMNISMADRAYFGQKDAQQLAVIRRMVRDLNMNVEVVGCPIIREADGLAKSSRNTYLSEEERKAGLVLSQAVMLGQKLVAEGEKQSTILKADAEKQAAILHAEAERQAAVLRAEGEAEAIMKVQTALADSIKLLNSANPNDQVVKLKALESFEKAADGQATKIIVPSEIQSLAGLAASFKGLLEDEKK